MTNSFLFTAHGAPVTQGSVNAFPTKGGRGVRVVSKTPALVEWREIVRHSAELAAHPGWEPVDDPAIVRMLFVMPRPKSAPKTRDILPEKDKDLDKLIRGALDGITSAGIWTDDSRVVDIDAKKVYAVGPELKRIYDPEIHFTTPRMMVEIRWLYQLSADADSTRGLLRLWSRPWKHPGIPVLS